MSQLSLSDAATLGSQLTGLPAAFVLALIQAEGTINNGHNNPFDVTQAYASYTQYPAIPGGGWGSQSQGNPNNPAGIASFPDIETGVRAWADGIRNQPIYADLRNAIQYTGNDFSLLLASFPSGYAGGSPTWANNVLALANQNVAAGVQNVGTPLQQLQTGTVTGSPPSAASVAASAGNTASTVTGVTIPPITIPGVSDIAGAVTNAGQGAVNAIQQAIAPVASLFSNLTTFLQFTGNPQVWVGVVMVVIGVLISLVGVILFGVSLIPSSVQKTGLKAATAIA